MNISPLSTNLIHILSPNQAVNFDNNGVTGGGQSTANFADILSDSLKTASQADTVDKISSLELLMGQNDDLSGLMLDMQKAELSLNLALQIRNKVVDAYNEIMRMSV